MDEFQNHCHFQNTVVWRIYSDNVKGSSGRHDLLGRMKPFKDLREVWVLGNDPELWIGKDPGQLFEKLWAGKERISSGTASTEDTGGWPFPSYSGDQSVGVRNKFQESRTLRIASLTTSGFTRALPTAE